MNIKIKLFIMCLLLLIIQSTATANTNFYPYIKSYSNCSVTVLEDDSVKVFFRAHLYDDLFSGEKTHTEQWEKLTNTSGEAITLSPHHAVLSLYFYKADGSPELNIPFNAISDLSLNGISYNNSNNNTQEIIFNSRADDALSHTYYDVSFNLAANTIQPIRIGATVGGILNIGKQQSSLLSLKGVSFGSSGKQCESFEPQAGVAPKAVKIDPKFRLSSAIWQLKPLDLDLLLDNTATGRGLDAQLENAEANRFCIHYQPMGIKNVKYRINAKNLNGLSTDSNHFQLKDKEKVINYQVILRTEYNSYDFSLPGNSNFTGFDKNVKEMCWTPKIQIFSTGNTDKGSYSDTLSFTVTPLA
ncbi:MAG: hypothetical protein ACRCUG_11560 [Yersinia sp. (in: enterobacteria)]